MDELEQAAQCAVHSLYALAVSNLVVHAVCCYTLAVRLALWYTLCAVIHFLCVYPCGTR